MVQNLRKISAYLFVLRMLRTVLSVVTVSLAAKFFGIGIERDIWLLVSAFIITINLAIWGPINETFRTKFVFLREREGEMVALRKTASLLSFVAWGTLGVSALVWIFPEFFMNLIAPSVGEEEKYMFIRMLRFLLPTFLINELTVLGIGLLNAYESFYIPEIVSFFFRDYSDPLFVVVSPNYKYLFVGCFNVFGIFFTFVSIDLFYIQEKNTFRIFAILFFVEGCMAFYTIFNSFFYSLFRFTV